MADHYLTNPRPPNKESTVVDGVILEVEDKMDRVLQAAKGELATIRAGRVSPSIFNGIVVNYYDTSAPFQQLASLTIPKAHTALVNPFNRSVMKDIATAIREPDLGVNPTNNSIIIRVTPPALTKERRKGYVEFAHSRAENSRVQIHGTRGEAKKEFKAIKKDGEVDENDVKYAEHELDGFIRCLIEQIGATLNVKEAKLLEV